jgi:cytochrome c peroxidase
MNKKSALLTLVILMIFSAMLVAQNLTPMEQLGKKLFFDKISEPDRQSCATCHAPEVGFVGPVPGINAHGSVYPGAVPQRFGNRNHQVLLMQHSVLSSILTQQNLSSSEEISGMVEQLRSSR